MSLNRQEQELAVSSKRKVVTLILFNSIQQGAVVASNCEDSDLHGIFMQYQTCFQTLLLSSDRNGNTKHTDEIEMNIPNTCEILSIEKWNNACIIY